MAERQDDDDKEKITSDNSMKRKEEFDSDEENSKSEEEEDDSKDKYSKSEEEEDDSKDKYFKSEEEEDDSKDEDSKSEEEEDDSKDEDSKSEEEEDDSKDEDSKSEEEEDDSKDEDSNSKENDDYWDDEESESNLESREPNLFAYLTSKLEKHCSKENISFALDSLATQIERVIQVYTGAPPSDEASSDDQKMDLQYSRFENDFDVLDPHGRGAFGVVFECKHKLDKCLYAVKRMPYEENGKQLMELVAMTRLRHPYIVRYYQAWIEPYKKSNRTPSLDSDDASDSDDQSATECLFIQMERCPTKLDGLIIDRRSGWKLFLQILEALDYMHKKNICHCDISNKNILLDIEGNCRIIDFGLARFLDEEVEDTRELVHAESLKDLQNRSYRAPEILKQDPTISAKVDIYSLGMLLVDIFYPCKTAQEKYQILDNLKTGRKLPKSLKEEDDDIKDALLRMTSTDPDHRPSTTELLLIFDSKR